MPAGLLTLCIRLDDLVKDGLIALMVLMMLLSPLKAAEREDWTGVWDTQWRGGGAVMELRQEGDRVEGTYPGFEGTVQGRVEGNEFSGTWSDAAGEGVFTFVMSPDDQSFMGRFGTGEWWTGMRAHRDIADMLFGVLDQSSPERTLLSFLLAGNKSGEGRSDRLGVVLPLLDFTAHGESMTPYRRIDLARLLFQIIDRLTFRVWELRPDHRLGADDEYSVQLSQAGSNMPYELVFRADKGVDESGERIWRMVIPPEDQMRESLEALLEIRDGALPHSREHHELGSPRDTMRTFLEQSYNAWSGNADLYLETMDLSQIAAPVRRDEGILLGEYLIEVLYRIGLPIRQEIPDYSHQRGAYTHFIHPAGVVEIHPVEHEDGVRRWQFSSETVASARQLFVAMEDMPLVDERVREQHTQFFEIRKRVSSLHRDLLTESAAGMELWQWIALVLWFALSIPISWLITMVIAKLFRLKNRSEDELSAKFCYTWPLRIILISGTSLLALRTLGLPQAVDIPLRIAIGVMLSIAGGWLAYHIVDKASKILQSHSDRYRYQDEMLRALATAFLKLCVIIGAALFLAEILSLPYQGVIAGLGIGGLAVALAARSTLENLIGGLTLLADKPVEVGDFCQLGDHLGVIESIGIRSVKIRSLDRSIITIPNAEFVNINIDNLTRRDRILLNTVIGLRFETTPDQLRWILKSIRELLLQHPMVTPEPARARFLAFGDHSIDIEIFAYIKTNDWNEFLSVREDIMLRLIDVVAESGTGFAFPSVVNYVTRDSGIDKEQTARAEDIMQKLREENELPFPDFSLEKRKQLRDTIDYPPLGSVDFEKKSDDHSATR